MKIYTIIYILSLSLPHNIWRIECLTRQIPPIVLQKSITTLDAVLFYLYNIFVNNFSDDFEQKKTQKYKNEIYIACR